MKTYNPNCSNVLWYYVKNRGHNVRYHYRKPSKPKLSSGMLMTWLRQYYVAVLKCYGSRHGLKSVSH